MLSVIQHIHLEASNVKLLLNNLRENSDLVRWNHSTIKISGLGDYQWDQLNDNGRIVQVQLLEKYSELLGWIRFLVTCLSAEKQRAMELSAQKVLVVINQTGNFFSMDKEEQFDNAIRAIDLQLQELTAAYEVTDSHCLVIPDTSALLSNPELDSWKFEGIERFELLLLPAIVNELDENTANTKHGKNKIKTKIMEYAKRGNIAAGVNLNEHNIIKFVGNIKEIGETLPELDVKNHLDQLLAAYFEIAKANSHSRVVLITGNPGLQEKARLLNAVCMEPPVLRVSELVVEAKQPEAKPAAVKQSSVEESADKVGAAKPTRVRAPRDKNAERPVADKTAASKAAEGKTHVVKPGRVKAADSKPDNTAIKLAMPPVMLAIPKGTKPKAPKPGLGILKPDNKPLLQKTKR